MTGTQAAGGFAKEPKAERKGTHIIASYTLLVENDALTSYEDIFDSTPAAPKLP